MSVLYLVRHGQAGTRENYDSLSDLGRRQARLLGQHFASQGIRFEAAYCGSLARQRATAAEAAGAYSAIPEPQVDAGWDEFDLAQVYSEFAPLLARDSPDFRHQYEEMQAAIDASRGAHDAPIHRRWNECDKAVVRAWVEAQYEYSGETWLAFSDRIRAALDRVARAGHEGNVLVFTSATPIGVAAASALQIFDGRALQLAGVLWNASFSTLRVRSGEIRLFQFNSGAHLLDDHLSEASLRTFR